MCERHLAKILVFNLSTNDRARVNPGMRAGLVVCTVAITHARVEGVLARQLCIFRCGVLV